MDSQLVDLPAGMYAIRGRAKESRSVSGTTGDDRNAAQRELRPNESSLDLGQYLSVSPVTFLPTFKFFLFYDIDEESWQFSNNMWPVIFKFAGVIGKGAGSGLYIIMWSLILEHICNRLFLTVIL